MQPINIVWLKRDLRLTDHEPLRRAIALDLPIMLLYVFEPLLLNDPHYSERHWRFVSQSLVDLDQQLARYKGKVTIMRGEILECFAAIQQHYAIKHIFSHQEIGLNCTYQRDKRVANWVSTHHIEWIESAQGAVIRGAKNRKEWDKHWQTVMRSPIVEPDLDVDWLSFNHDNKFHFPLPAHWLEKVKGYQTGGSTLAWQTLNDFFQRRGKDYYRSISSPMASRCACTRLSPYLAWGNISLREAYQHLLRHWQVKGFRRSLIALSSRLHWHCHFIQKFESESEMEYRCVNRAYDALLGESSVSDPEKLTAWAQGNTGIPLVDACMRCLHHTGYMNFRMRAMLVSFLTHHMNMDWRDGVTHLARLFLDFEPGIHYPQFQMQAGVTGTNTIRIYNPTKQAQEHDAEGEFIKQWVPELALVPTPLLFEPWTMTHMEALMYQVDDNSRYLSPIIDLQEQAKVARDRLWSWRKLDHVKHEGRRILKRHVRTTKSNDRDG